jgi:hypothetical protein
MDRPRHRSSSNQTTRDMSVRLYNGFVAVVRSVSHNLHRHSQSYSDVYIRVDKKHCCWHLKLSRQWLWSWPTVVSETSADFHQTAISASSVIYTNYGALSVAASVHKLPYLFIKHLTDMRLGISTDVKIVLKWILNKQDNGVQTGLVWSGRVSDLRRAPVNMVMAKRGSIKGWVSWDQGLFRLSRRASSTELFCLITYSFTKFYKVVKKKDISNANVKQALAPNYEV